MSRPAGTLLLTIACTFVAASPALGAARVVRSMCLPPMEVPTIQIAINLACPLDTIVVGPGEYNESLVLSGKDLIILGDTPAPVVAPPSGSRGIRIGPGVTAATHFRNLVFSSGQADSGGAVYLAAGCGAVFSGCSFFWNAARGHSLANSLGGAVFVGAGASLRLEDCKVRGNTAQSSYDFEGVGGAIYVAAGGALDARGVAFQRNMAAGFEGGWGGAIALGDASATFGGCAFDSNSAGYGGAISGNGWLTLAQCTLRGNSGLYGESAVSFDGTGGYSLSGSVFHDNESFAAGTVALGRSGTVEGNTFAWNGRSTPGGGAAACLLLEESSSTVRDNIIARNRGVGIASPYAPVAGAVSCNDVWGNADGNYGGAYPDLTGQYDNLSADPVFCDSAGRVFTLGGGTPCAPAGACGLIGALGVMCPPLAVPEARGGPIARLLPARPNPARGAVSLTFLLAEDADVRLEVVDLAGRRIALLADGQLGRGLHERRWSGLTDRGEPARPGVYYATLLAGSHRETRTLVVLP